MNYIVSEEIVKLQKFVNTPFFYSELEKFIDGRRDNMLQPNIMAKIEEVEYNALWDTFKDMEDWFKKMDIGNVVMGVMDFSINNIYLHNLKSRKAKLGF